MAKATVTIKPSAVISGRIFSKDVKIFFGQTAVKLMNPYIPYDSGALSKNYVVTEDYIEFQQPYAHKQHEGDNFNFSRDMHPLACAHWEDAMMKAKSGQLAKAVTDYINRK